MNINLRGLSEELHQKLRVVAIAERVSLQSLCVRYLWWGLERMGGIDAIGTSEVQRDGRSGGGEVVPGESGRSGVAERFGPRAAGVSGVGFRGAEGGVSGVGAEAAVEVVGERPTCRGCEGSLTKEKGFWVCTDQACGQCGVEQKQKKGGS